MTIFLNVFCGIYFYLFTNALHYGPLLNYYTTQDTTLKVRHRDLVVAANLRLAYHQQQEWQRPVELEVELLVAMLALVIEKNP